MTIPPLRPGLTRPGLMDDLIKLFVAIFLIPLPVEVLLSFIKREPFDFERLTVVAVAVGVAALGLVLIRRRRELFVNFVVAYYVLSAGVAIAAFGIVLSLRPELIVESVGWSLTTATTLGALMPSLGLLLVAAGAFLIRDRNRRKGDYKTLPPTNIRTPQVVDVGPYKGSVWVSEKSDLHPATAGLIDICRKYLDPQDLHVVAFYSRDGDCLFFLDVFRDPGMASYDVHNPAQRREYYEAAGHLMRYLSVDLDRIFQPLESGAIVRLVFDVEKGALFCYRLRSEGVLLGVTLNQREVDPADRKLSTLSNEILTYLGQAGVIDFVRGLRVPEICQVAPG